MCKRLHDSDYWCGNPSAVPTRNLCVLCLMFSHGALGVNYIDLAPVSAISVSDVVSSVRGRSVVAILGN